MGLPGQGDACPPLIYLTKAPHKVGQPAAASRPGCGPLAGPPRDGASHGRAMRRWFALRTGHPMKGGLGPGCGREARRYPMAAGPSRPNERNSASAGGSRSRPSISAAVCGDGPRRGEAGRAAGAGARARVGPAPWGWAPPAKAFLPAATSFGEWENARGSTRSPAPQGCGSSLRSGCPPPRGCVWDQQAGSVALGGRSTQYWLPGAAHPAAVPAWAGDGQNWHPAQG